MRVYHAGTNQIKGILAEFINSMVLPRACIYLWVLFIQLGWGNFYIHKGYCGKGVILSKRIINVFVFSVVVCEKKRTATHLLKKGKGGTEEKREAAFD